MKINVSVTYVEDKSIARKILNIAQELNERRSKEKSNLNTSKKIIIKTTKRV